MKRSKFLIIPKSNFFRDVINVKEIANEIKQKGHDCFTLTSQISDKNLEFILREEKFDFVFRVNKGKPEKIKKSVRFISWLTEISDFDECLQNFNENDLIYTLKKNSNNNKKLKINQMLGAANNLKNISTVSKYSLINDKFDSFQDIDISLISNYSRVDLFNGNKALIYKKSKKNRDKHKNFHEIFNNLNKKLSIQIFSLINFSKLINCKNVNYNGEVNNFNYLFEIFRKSKFNLLFEDEFLDFNTNFFNILLVEGTLIFNKKILNQIKTYLNLSKTLKIILNYEDLKSFNLNISNYHNNLNKRIEIGKNASQLVIKRHLYKNRVEQILKDLN